MTEPKANKDPPEGPKAAAPSAPLAFPPPTVRPSSAAAAEQAAPAGSPVATPPAVLGESPAAGSPGDAEAAPLVDEVVTLTPGDAEAVEFLDDVALTPGDAGAVEILDHVVAPTPGGAGAVEILDHVVALTPGDAEAARPAGAATPPATLPAPPSAADHVAMGGAVTASTHLLAGVIMVMSLMMVLWHMQLSSRENANTGSRYATIESLVDYGTYNIDASRYVFTPDKVKARDHFVSSKPPLLPTYGAGVYWLLKRVTGYTITDNESIVVWTVGVFTGWLGHLIFLIYFYRLCCLLLVRQLAVLACLMAASFASLGVAYATAINNHSPGATLAVVGFYYAYRARSGIGTAKDWVLAGLWLGVLPAIDLSCLALTGLTAVYLATRSWKRTLLLYLPFIAPGIASQILLAHHATGAWIPAYADSSLMTYSGSYFGGRRAGIDALFEPKTTYAYNVLIGHHGLFSMTPIFGFSLFEIVRRLVRRDKFFAETAVFATTVMVVCAFYIFRTHNYGGWCVGMRWLVPVMPWLVMLFGLWLDRAKLGRIKWAFVTLAFAISAFNVQDGLTSPFQFSAWHNWLEDAPNRNRLGPTWVLSHGKPTDKKRPPKPARPKAAPPPTAGASP
jgi:hypothetical protein